MIGCHFVSGHLEACINQRIQRRLSVKETSERGQKVGGKVVGFVSSWKICILCRAVVNVFNFCFLYSDAKNLPMGSRAFF